jgi:hypothetical protein
MAAPPAVALVQNLVKNQKRKIKAIYKKKMLFGFAPSAKNSDFTARLRHLPSPFFFAIYFHSGVQFLFEKKINFVFGVSCCFLPVYFTQQSNCQIALVLTFMCSCVCVCLMQ